MVSAWATAGRDHLAAARVPGHEMRLHQAGDDLQVGLHEAAVELDHRAGAAWCRPEHGPRRCARSGSPRGRSAAPRDRPPVLRALRLRWGDAGRWPPGRGSGRAASRLRAGARRMAGSSSPFGTGRVMSQMRMQAERAARFLRQGPCADWVVERRLHAAARSAAPACAACGSRSRRVGPATPGAGCPCRSSVRPAWRVSLLNLLRLDTDIHAGKHTPALTAVWRASFGCCRKL